MWEWLQTRKSYIILLFPWFSNDIRYPCKRLRNRIPGLQRFLLCLKFNHRIKNCWDISNDKGTSRLFNILHSILECIDVNFLRYISWGKVSYTRQKVHCKTMQSHFKSDVSLLLNNYNENNEMSLLFFSKTNLWCHTYTGLTQMQCYRHTTNRHLKLIPIHT